MIKDVIETMKSERARGLSDYVVKNRARAKEAEIFEIARNVLPFSVDKGTPEVCANFAYECAENLYGLHTKAQKEISTTKF